MLILNIITEFRIIYRNYWLAAITLLLLVLCLYAGWNGNNRVTLREENILAAIDEMKTSDELMIARLDSLTLGLEINLASWQYPSVPTATGDHYPRVAAFKPSQLSLISTGQSDMFNHYVKPTLTDDSFSIGFTELASPVSLLMGNFDLSFVLIFLLPLVIISFSYNILSSEKEQGSLLLIASSPRDIHLWLLQKVLTRFLIINLLLSVCLWLTFLFNGVTIEKPFFAFLVLVWVYSAFWFTLAYVVNLWGASSSNNAMYLIGSWIILVLAIPSLINQSANAVYPAPSRTLLINEMRTLQAEIDAEQDKILDSYLRNHPELITSREAEEGTAYLWWQRYFASKDLLLDKMSPLLAEYDESLRKQQRWVSKLSFLSPSVLFQNNLNYLAETSAVHYDVYRQSVLTFTEEWRNFFLPLIFQEKPFTKAMISKLPEFRFEKSEVISPVATNLLLLLGISIGLLFISFPVNKKRGVERLMT